MSSKKTILTGQSRNSPKIDPGSSPYGREIHVGASKKGSNKWSFGFKYFAEIKYFEIGGVEKNWYISLIDRLKEVSQIDRDKFLKDFSQHSSIRYHEINWGSNNVPIKRSDLSWIDSHILNNEEEYPMLQFHVSKALGRVVGFWDDNIFQVVLLDPMHNIQPSNYNAYKVNDTYKLSCDYSSLLIDINRIQNKIKEGNQDVVKEIMMLPSKLNNTNFFFCSLDDDYLEKLTNSNHHFKDIIEIGLLSIQ